MRKNKDNSINSEKISNRFRTSAAGILIYEAQLVISILTQRDDSAVLRRSGKLGRCLVVSADEKLIPVGFQFPAGVLTVVMIIGGVFERDSVESSRIQLKHRRSSLVDLLPSMQQPAGCWLNERKIDADWALMSCHDARPPWALYKLLFNRYPLKPPSTI